MNRLAGALSPYLLQHAKNPVHWQPWDELALREAREKDKPILLSVGYAACHWCHVMARESFADAETAAVMNGFFVNIKVDREERPDLDRIYQAAHYLFARRAGGWPLTMFLTPAGEPFFGGTYFPKESGRGMPTFISVMEKVAQAWRERRAEIHEQNARLIPLLQSFDESPAADGELTDAPIAQAAAAFAKMADAEHGGFRGAPKFPHPSETAFMMREGILRGDDFLLQSARRALEKMAAGGICDHPGGGFFRYSVDERWQIPHFEKMLSDNGLMLALYAEGAALWQAKEMAQTADGIARWTLAEMRAPGGAFYSSLDADSEGGEGAFYVWDAPDALALLDGNEAEVLSSAFALSAPPNFEGEKWHLARRQTLAQTARAVKKEEKKCAALLHSALQKLLAERGKRARPAVDDKILAGWNALMIRGLARAGRLLDRPEWIAAAAAALDFLRGELRPQGRLLSLWREGKSGGAAFLDDGAFLLAAVLELLRARFSAELLHFAGELAEEILAHFEDEKKGGFYFQAKDQETLIRRPKPADDNATPAGNGVLCESLLLLSRLNGDDRLRIAAEKGLRALYGAVCEQPAGCCAMLAALRAHLSPPPLLFLTGDAKICGEWKRALQNDSDVLQKAGDVLVFVLPANAEGLPEVLQKETPQKGALGHVCGKNSCLPPIDNFPNLKKAVFSFCAG